MKTIAILSLLAEPPSPGPLNRRFRGEAVIRWTLRRLSRVESLGGIVVLAWDDQLQSLSGLDAGVFACGQRRNTSRIDSLAAAGRWCDGWRGGLLQSTPFDVGFSAKPIQAAMTQAAADACVIVEPAAGLVDSTIIGGLCEAAAAGTREFYFTAAAPGLGGVLLKRSLVDRLTQDGSHAGRLLHYLPEAPILDPRTSDACVAVPLPVCRTTARFPLDSDRQIERIERATVPLNGTLMASEAETLVSRVNATAPAGRFPREVTLELTTRREARPTFAASTHLPVNRPDLAIEEVEKIVEQLAACDDIRVTLGGVGDPLLHPQVDQILPLLRTLHSVHIETDLLQASDELLRSMVESRIDVLSVMLPAATPATYARIMGVDAMPRVLDNIRRLLVARQQADSGLPLVVPRFVKLADNFAEMEAWHDTWLRAVGSAVIGGPSTFAGRLPDLGVADMTPPLRRPCARLAQRMTILSDGSIVSCEEDVTGQQVMGKIQSDTIADVWHRQFGQIRERHEKMIDLPVLCGNCKEWHRP